MGPGAGGGWPLCQELRTVLTPVLTLRLSLTGAVGSHPSPQNSTSKGSVGWDWQIRAVAKGRHRAGGASLWR